MMMMMIMIQNTQPTRTSLLTKDLPASWWALVPCLPNFHPLPTMMSEEWGAYKNTSMNNLLSNRTPRNHVSPPSPGSPLYCPACLCSAQKMHNAARGLHEVHKLSVQQRLTVKETIQTKRNSSSHRSSSSRHCHHQSGVVRCLGRFQCVWKQPFPSPLDITVSSLISGLFEDCEKLDWTKYCVGILFKRHILRTI